ncbi:MAG: hypothetical protein VKK04_08970 [Synechococcales bacterium]|nr:hypothetical protein [Synechococcales bacterium]
MATDRFAYVQEENAPFLSLFPHRYDFIYAAHPQPNERPHWQTERRYPLSDRLIQQGNYLYGVRFGRETRYCLLDIDAGSSYHPRQDAFAIARITAALESLGLVSSIVCTSSYSGGLHLYFPFSTPHPSWQIAAVVSQLLESAGLLPAPGQLEVFPNPKPYVSEGTISLFNAHRLPLQTGSYLLDADLQPVWSDPWRFSQQWHHCQQHNEVRSSTLKSLLRQFRRTYTRLSRKADQFLQDLNAEIDQGWTGFGQTNRLLGRMALRCYVFHHVLHGGQPLAGQALVDEIVATARSLPGFFDWCRHQEDLTERAAEWARCVEASRYFPYGYGKRPCAEDKDSGTEAVNDPKPVSWNQRQATETQNKIQAAIADLVERNTLPLTPTARFKALLQYGIGGGSLYRYRCLWHPDHITYDLRSNRLESVRLDPNERTDQKDLNTSLDEPDLNLSIDPDPNLTNLDLDPQLVDRLVDRSNLLDHWSNSLSEGSLVDMDLKDLKADLEKEDLVDLELEREDLERESLESGSKLKLALDQGIKSNYSEPDQVKQESLKYFGLCSIDWNKNLTPASQDIRSIQLPEVLLSTFPNCPKTLHYLPSLFASQGGNPGTVYHRSDRPLVVPVETGGNPPQKDDWNNVIGQLAWFEKDLSKVGCLEGVLADELIYGVDLDHLSLKPWLWWIQAQDGAS